MIKTPVVTEKIKYEENTYYVVTDTGGRTLTRFLGKEEADFITECINTQSLQGENEG